MKTLFPKLKIEKVSAMDGNLLFDYMVEETLTRIITNNPLSRVVVDAETFEGMQTFRLANVPPEELDQVLEWLSELDVERIISVGVGPVVK